MIRSLATMTPESIDASVFRLRPRFDAPKEGRVWIWGLLLSETTVPDYRRCLDSLSKVRIAEMAVLPQHSQDGPIIKWIAGLGAGGNDAGDDMDFDEDEDAHPDGRGRKDKRPRAGGR